MSGNKDCHEFRFLIVRIVISVSNVTSLQDCLLKIVSLILPPREYEELSFKLSTCGIMWYQHSYSPTDNSRMTEGSSYQTRTPLRPLQLASDINIPTLPLIAAVVWLQ